MDQLEGSATLVYKANLDALDKHATLQTNSSQNKNGSG